MSPTTEANVRALLSACHADDKARSEGKPSVLTKESLTTIRHEIERRIETDEKYAEARFKLEKLTADAWLLRYGDYHATTLGAIRAEARKISRKATREARRERKKLEKRAGSTGGTTTTDAGNAETETDAAVPPMPLTTEDATLVTFMTKKWVMINDALEAEEAASRDALLPETVLRPMTDLIRKLVTGLPAGTLYEDIRLSIKLYACRNDLVHGHAGILASSGRFHELASKLNEDLIDLQRNTSINEESRQSTVAAIMGTIGTYFGKFTRHPDTGELLSYREWPLVDGKFVRTTGEPAESGTADEDDATLGGIASLMD